MRGSPRAAFSLVELLAVIAVVAILAALLLPAVTQGMVSAREATCTGNLRQMYAAFLYYLQDHEGQFFPWMERRGGQNLWFWGLETGPGAEGTRQIDRSQARLAPYLGADTVETCPDFPYRSTQFKRKFETSTYGYGLNVFLIQGQPEQVGSGVDRWSGVERPDATIAWADAVQVNRFQAPASPSNPMLEEWYYIANRTYELPTTHFRHGGKVNAVFCDGSVRSLAPQRLLGFCDGRVGALEPAGQNHYLMTKR